MRKIILCMHTSLDGFVGGPNGEMDWIKISAEIFERAKALTDEADTALYGRVTYNMMESYWPDAGKKPKASKHDIEHSEWYNKVEKIVISKTLESNNANTRIISENIIEEIKALKQRSGKNILIFGSPSLSHLLMSNDLIDEYWIMQNPILLGKGIPMFSDIKDRVKLILSDTKKHDSGVMELHYSRQ